MLKCRHQRHVVAPIMHFVYFACTTNLDVSLNNQKMEDKLVLVVSAGYAIVASRVVIMSCDSV